MRKILLATPPEEGHAAKHGLRRDVRWQTASLKRKVQRRLIWMMGKAGMCDLSKNVQAPGATPERTPLKLRTVLAEIAEHACEPGFSAMAVAEKYGVSEREVRQLLKKTGKSFSEHKLRRRLERARALLGDPAAAHLAVPEIALRVGFSDLESFDANYRRKFGVAPDAARGATEDSAQRERNAT